jgi:hypothetical protein
MVLSEKASSWVRIIANVLLIIFNTFVVINIFREFGSDNWYALVWGAIGFIIVFIQIYSLMQAKGAKGRKKFQPFVTYALATIFSISGTLGFTLSEIALSKKVDTVETTALISTQEDVTYYQKKIEGLNRDIEVLRKENENEKTPSWKRSENTSSMKRIQADITKAEDEWKASKANEKVAVVETLKKKSGATKFDYIAEALSFIPNVKIKGEGLKNFLMLLLSFLLEYFIYYTAEPIKEKNKRNENGELEEEEQELVLEDTKEPLVEKREEPKLHIIIERSEKEKVEAYINALFEVNGERLNSSDKISQMTGIPLEDCKRYRLALLTMKWKGNPLLISSKGGTRSRFTKEDIIKVVTFRLNYQEEDATTETEEIIEE